MKKLICICVVLSLFFISACGFSTAKITDIVSTKSVDEDGKPTEVTSVFTPSDNYIYVSAKVKNAPSDTKVIVKWYLDDKFVDKSTLEIDDSSYVYAYVGSKDGLPKGNYKSEMYINDREKPDQISTMVVE